ncbi:MAG: MFS transporter [Ignavibacteriaceae bacterium]|nr:MFS transporter [Ignavibacteriaceae bacterium]
MSNTNNKLFNKNFFLLWQGQTVSNIGNQVFSVAMILWIKHVTNSAELVGIILMTSTIPAVLLSAIGGAFADRYSRRNIIVISDILNGLGVLSLFALMYFAPESINLTIAWLLFLSCFIASVNSFFTPAISASVPDIVPGEKLAAANSLVQFSLQISLFIGQGLGGILYRLIGPVVLVFFNGFSYIFSGISEIFIKIPQKIPEKSESLKSRISKFKEEILEGFKYVWGYSGLKKLVLLSTMLNLFTTPIIVLLPFFVEDHLRLSSDWYGYFLAIYGLGSMFGYLIAGILKLNGIARRNTIIASIFIESALFGTLGFMSMPLVILFISFFAGSMNGFVSVNVITILQSTTKSEIRGRVFGFLMTLSGAMVPLGMGISGFAYELIGRDITLLYGICAIIMSALTIIFSFGEGFRNYLAQDISSTIGDSVIQSELSDSENKTEFQGLEPVKEKIISK